MRQTDRSHEHMRENDLLSLFSTYGNIPKTIHIAWNNKEIVDSTYSIIRNGIHNLKNLNRDYDFTISNDREIDEYLNSRLERRDFDLIKKRHIVEKVDLWRLLKIYYEGGFYMDIDRLYNIPLENVISKDVKCLLPMYGDKNFSQDIMISCPKNIIHKTAISLNLERRRSGSKSILYLGPQTYFHACTRILLGEEKNEYPNKEDLIRLRKTIRTCKYIRTYREVLPYDSIVFQSEGTDIDFDKNQLYSDENILRWADRNKPFKKLKHYWKRKLAARRGAAHQDGRGLRRGR